MEKGTPDRGDSMCEAKFVLANVRATAGSQKRTCSDLYYRKDPSGCCCCREDPEWESGGRESQVREAGSAPAQLIAMEMEEQGQIPGIFRR